MRYVLTALCLLVLVVLPLWADNCPKDFFFFVKPIVPQPAVLNPPVMPQASAPTIPSAVSLDQVTSVLGSCVRCHSAPNPKGKTTLFDAAGTFAPAVTAAVVYAAVADDSMPLGGPPLSRTEKNLLRRWAGVTKSEVTTP